MRGGIASLGPIFPSRLNFKGTLFHGRNLRLTDLSKIIFTGRMKNYIRVL